MLMSFGKVASWPKDLAASLFNVVRGVGWEVSIYYCFFETVLRKMHSPENEASRRDDDH
jgi:hypothetical protein